MTRNHLMLGVAGHVDHGKTALVKALTGIETDRLKEEQERGMSIVLGFAHLDLPEGRIDVVDVPGHEKFIKTMISGATGIDAVLLAIAANERVKPQTLEHLMLVDLLGVRRGVIVVTKSDLVSPDDHPGIERDLRAFVQPTFLANAPLVFASALMGDGLDALRDELRVLLLESRPRARHPFFTLPIDRAFTIAGQGTVVTGTLRRGGLAVGQAVEILPGRRRVEIRGLEAHNQPTPSAEPGWRTAANLRGVKKEEIPSGALLATPGFLQPTRMMDARLRLLSTAPHALVRGQTVRLHWGTTEALGRVYPLLETEVAPGASAFVQIRFSIEQFVPAHEPVIIRTVSPVETIGGGIVLDAHPRRRSTADDHDVRLLPALEREDVAVILLEKARISGFAGRSLTALARERGWDMSEAEPVLDGLPIVRLGDLLVTRDALNEIRAAIGAHIRAFHAANPLLPGMPKQTLRQQLPTDLASAAFAHALDDLANSGALALESGLVREASFDADTNLPPGFRETARKIEDRYRKGGLQPPDLNNVIAGDTQRRDAAQYLLARGRLLAAEDCTNDRTVIFHPAAVAHAMRLLAKRVTDDGNTVSEITAILGTTRKYSIPLLEYLDATGATRRIGDKRVWNKWRVGMLKEEPTPALPRREGWGGQASRELLETSNHDRPNSAADRTGLRRRLRRQTRPRRSQRRRAEPCRGAGRPERDCRLRNA